MSREPGLSVRLKLALSYAAVIVVVGAMMIAAVFAFYVVLLPRIDVIHTTGSLDIDRTRLIRAFVPFVAAVLAGLLVVGLVGGWFLAGWMLRPLAQITAATRLAATGSLTHRIALPGRSDEFRELADAFDDMLARLHAHVAEEQRFAANASHELRTPLAITRTLLDVARGDPDRDITQLLDRLAAVNTRAIDLTEALLVLSRADQRSFAREPVDLSLLAEEATETLLPLAERHGITVEIAGPQARALGSQALLLQMTTNLLHNAIVHNLPGGSVWITTRVDAATAELVVENTGDILPAPMVSTLIEPFQRGAARVRTHDAGVGLGLAIVDSIVRAHAGTLTLTPRPEGGLRATVTLSPAHAPR
ncbi:two-component sensor histidine kinase [Nocardia neocaledoniensis NBRC 108232]|uniref:histidine kinase n=1 Tax=Nocardia neocaledoniensis TaxID=236511 RepID=A0A317NND9_9NOCA|nr:HAMP domain-containing sensor histidine kinase [Nocardia neocaledoniensis]PWV75128.1 two-component system sensor histidine kinase VanS [Nocardia neocaledoniensis]GEM34072.1 two-component sensor histidine kinase [Nocardia neocaledoniensis NBRC 108232]